MRPAAAPATHAAGELCRRARPNGRADQSASHDDRPFPAFTNSRAWDTRRLDSSTCHPTAGSTLIIADPYG